MMAVGTNPKAIAEKSAPMRPGIGPLDFPLRVSSNIKFIAMMAGT